MMLGRLAAWRWTILAGGIALGWVTVIGVAQYLAGDGIFIDWLAYALGTERVLNGQSLYLPEQMAGPYQLPAVTPQGYIYPPPSALLFVPFALGPLLGVTAWLAANLALFFSGLAAILHREFGVVRPMHMAIVLLGLAVLVPLPEHFVMPLANGVVNANVNVGFAGLLAWCWAVGSRRAWIPWVAGVAATFKIFPGGLALWAARQYGWRPLFITAGVAGAIVLVTLPIVGIEEWRRFTIALSNAQPTCEDARASVACVVQPFAGASIAKISGVVVGVVLLAAAVVVRSEFAAFVLLTLGMLAPIADGHHHYLLYIYVLIVIGAARYAARRARARDSVDGRRADPAVT
jgi:hypothetical protein